MSTKYPKCLVIVGSGRSGTSWLSETMSKTFRYRLLFEPDQDHQIKAGEVLTDKYLLPGGQYPEVDSYLKKVFRNRIDSDWIAQNSFRKYKMHLWPFLSKKYIIKFVRVNLGSLYIQEQFNLPVVHIIRNPYSVIFSQDRVKFPWLYDFSKFQAQEHLLDMVNESYGIDLTATYDDIEKLAIRWALENIYTIQHQKGYAQKVDLYKQEDLADNIDLFREICMKYNLEEPKNLESIYKKPSSKTHPNSNIRADKKSDYRSLIKADDKKKINAILERFEMTIYPFQD